MPVAIVALVVGGPAGVGIALFFAHLGHVGTSPSALVNTRAVFSVAWVAGPPLATGIMGGLGNRTILVAIAAVAVLGMATTLLMIRGQRRPPVTGRWDSGPAVATTDRPQTSRGGLVVLVAA